MLIKVVFFNQVKYFSSKMEGEKALCAFSDGVWKKLPFFI